MSRRPRRSTTERRGRWLGGGRRCLAWAAPCLFWATLGCLQRPTPPNVVGPAELDESPSRGVSPRDRAPSLQALLRSPNHLELRLVHPYFYDLDGRRLRTMAGDWDEWSAEDGRPPRPSFSLLVERLANHLSRSGALSFCTGQGDDAQCRPCPKCVVSVLSIEEDVGGPPAVNASGHLSRALVRFDRVETVKTRGSLCRLKRVVLSPGPPEPPSVDVFAPRVALRFLVKGFTYGMKARPWVRVRFPGWSEPFISDAYGVEVRDHAPDGRWSTRCRSIDPSSTQTGHLPTFVSSRIERAEPGLAEAHGAFSAPQGAVPRTRGLGAGPGRVAPYDPTRDATEVELLGWQGQTLTISVTEPHIYNLDASALMEDGPGHGWDRWDPIGWSRDRCEKYRSLQCLMWAYAESLTESGRLEVERANGQVLTCGEGCHVRLLEVAPALEDGANADYEGLEAAVRAARVPRGQTCVDCVMAADTHHLGGRMVQFMSPDVRIVLEVRLSETLTDSPRKVRLEQPGIRGPGNWFAGVDVGVPLLEASGQRIGRARSFCDGSVLSGQATTRSKRVPAPTPLLR